MKTKTYPRLLDCHPVEIESLRRTMFVQGYLCAKEDEATISKPKKFERLRREADRAFDSFTILHEADRAFDSFTKTVKRLHKEMRKRAAKKRVL